MKNSESKKKFPWFWLIYTFYVLALAGAICYGLSVLWKFLDVYEATRPKYYMESSLSLFSEDETENLSSYLSNTVDNPYEDKDALLSVFYDSIRGKKLSYGKLSGQYSETHPVYVVLADDTQVATISFVSDQVNAGYNFCGWNVESISLLVSPTKSFAVTIPDSMTLTINGQPASEQHILSTVETDTPVSYVNYACNGELYLEPQIQVTDRNGSTVPLQKDETTGAWYYQLSYATVPSSTQLLVGGIALGEENILTSGNEITGLEFLADVANHFPEYETLPELVEIPSFNDYFIDLAHTPGDVVAVNRFGNEQPLDYDSLTRTYSHELISNDSLKEECIDVAKGVLEAYTLFTAGDAEASALSPYFPENSKYYKLIVSMDNRWFRDHSTIQFTNPELKEFFAYTDNLVYIHYTFQQEFRIRYAKKDTITPVDIPLWLVKMDGHWYVIRMIYDNYISATE